MNIHDLVRELREPADSKIVLLVADGLGGLPLEAGGRTELETASTPNLDALVRDGDPRADPEGRHAGRAPWARPGVPAATRPARRMTQPGVGRTGRRSPGRTGRWSLDPGELSRSFGPAGSPLHSPEPVQRATQEGPRQTCLEGSERHEHWRESEPSGDCPRLAQG